MRARIRSLSALTSTLVAALAAACGQSVGKPPLEAPSQGYQLSVEPFEVPAGTETQRCFFFEVPSDEPVYVTKFEIQQNAGTHHMNVFRVRTQKGLAGAPGDAVVEGECWKSSNWSDWPLVVNSQESGDPQRPGYTQWTLPEGVAMRFEPRELLMVQSHYVNASTQKTPTKAQVFVNFHTADAASITDEVGTAFATNQSIRICPGEQHKFFETSCRFHQDKPVTIIAANSHFHSRGTRFAISVLDPKSGAAEQPFYVSSEWADPPMEWGLSVPVPAGGGVQYRCEYSVPANTCGDPDNSCCFTFGGLVETQEHCNAFIYYYPKVRDVGCF